MKRNLLLGFALFAAALPVAAQGGLDPAATKQVAARSDAILAAFDALCLKAVTGKSTLLAAGPFGAIEQAAKASLASTREYPITVAGAPAKLAVREDYSCVLTVGDIDTEVLGARFDAMLRRRPGASAQPLEGFVFPWEALHRVASWPRAGGKSPWDIRIVSSIAHGERSVRMIRSDPDEVVEFDDPSPMAVAAPPPPPPVLRADSAPDSRAAPLRNPPAPTTDSYAPYEVPSGRERHPPRVPESAVAACAHGVARLRVTINQRSNVLDVRVEESSGHADLDAAAAEAARHWAYLPGRFRGEPIGGDIVVPVFFADPCK
jgi:TonB family protein